MHHTVTADDDPDPAATLRAIYDDHVHNPARDFGDIGYHVLIDAAGTLYEGRNGENSSPLFGHRFVDGRWEMVRAAHVALNNTGNLASRCSVTSPRSSRRRWPGGRWSACSPCRVWSTASIRCRWSTT